MSEKFRLNLYALLLALSVFVSVITGLVCIGLYIAGLPEYLLRAQNVLYFGIGSAVVVLVVVFLDGFMQGAIRDMLKWYRSRK